jgi:hypothetical protein
MYLQWKRERTSNWQDRTPLPPSTVPGIKVRACGLFDTVASLDGSILDGFKFFSRKPKRREAMAFVDQEMCGNIDNLYQALAMNERRNDFRKVKKRGTVHRQILQQVWFWGSHSQIGGSVDQRKDNLASDITLIWMAAKLWSHVPLSREKLTYMCRKSLRRRQELYMVPPPATLGAAQLRGRYPNSATFLWQLGRGVTPRNLNHVQPSDRVQEPLGSGPRYLHEAYRVRAMDNAQ